MSELAQPQPNAAVQRAHLQDTAYRLAEECECAALRSRRHVVGQPHVAGRRGPGRQAIG